MTKMPFRWVEPPAQPRGKFKPYLLLALTAAVLVFCWVVGGR